ncbi:MAG: sulfite exporter TauE/SafE family protein [Fluviibacter sp.]
MTWWLLGYVALGLGSGFIAGLFGVGGGLTIVPILLMLFKAQGFPEGELMHLSLGTAMATIVVTSISSMRAHHQHGGVRWDIFRGMAPGLVTGTLVGSLFASGVQTDHLAIAFTAIVYWASLQMLLDFKPKPTRQLPGFAGLLGAGGAIGGVSSLVAAGGGFLSVPFMVLCNVPIRQAVGTSAALGLPIAAAGVIGYIAGGWSVAGLPGPNLGFIYLPAFFGVVLSTVFMAPVGARLAHQLPVKQLKRAFGGMLALLATKMLWTLIG